MKRAEREITDRSQIDAILNKAAICRLALAVADEPYLVPVSYGYDGVAIYFHTAKAGRKLEMIARNPRVCFEVEGDTGLVCPSSEPCRWTYAYESVIGFGTVSEVIDTKEKRSKLDLIVAHYTTGASYQGVMQPVDNAKSAGARVWKINIESVTGKFSPAKS
jgi:uncharacterized protein